MIEGLIVGILEQGLIYGIMAMGVYITYTILDFPDLSVDGTFPLGIAICFVMINNGLNPWLALLAAFAAGCIAGMFTGIFNVKLRIRNLLCGILTMTALYSINYGIVGKASDFLSMDTTTIFSQTAFLFGNGHLAESIEISSFLRFRRRIRIRVRNFVFKYHYRLTVRL